MQSGTCAFTGHRPAKFPWKYDELDSRCIALKQVLARYIKKLAAYGMIDFFSGMALGTDIWAAQATLELRNENHLLKLHCLLPCKDQVSKWTASARKQYQTILDLADTVEYVSRTYHKDCMMERNHRLVDSANILLAVYNSEFRGGTAATIRYAQRHERKIIVIDPISLQVTQDYESIQH